MIKIDKFPTLLAAHQADVRGPPVGRGPQVENRCPRLFKAFCCIIFYFRWSELQVWPQEALVKHVKGLFKAEGYNNAAEPGNGSHSRFYVSIFVNCLSSYLTA